MRRQLLNVSVCTCIGVGISNDAVFPFSSVMLTRLSLSLSLSPPIGSQFFCCVRNKSIKGVGKKREMTRRDRLTQRQKANNVCFDQHGNREFCYGGGTAQWLRGITVILVVEILAFVLLGALCSSFFGIDIFNFKNTTAQLIWGIGIGFILVSVIFYVYKYGFKSVGAPHAAGGFDERSVAERATVRKDTHLSRFDEFYRQRVEGGSPSGEEMAGARRTISLGSDDVDQ